MTQYDHDDNLNGAMLDDDADASEKQTALVTQLSAGAAGAGQELDIEDDSPRGGGLLSQNMLLLGVAGLVAAGTIYAMGISQGTLGRAAVASEHEAAVDNLLVAAQKNGSDGPFNFGATIAELNQRIGDLEYDRSEQQVPIEYVKKDPFELFVEKKKEEPVKVEDNTAELAQQRAKLLQSLAREAEKLKLEMISNGPQGRVAMINGTFVQAGRTIGSFEVEAIEQFEVVLKAEGERFRLTLDR